jgi:hypothetical protein
MRKTREEALKDYVSVNERLMKFREEYPDGIIHTEIIKWTDDGTIVMKAVIYRNPEEFERGVYIAVGHAYEQEGSSYINNGNALENCETSAVGRALAFMGYEIKKSIASWEEVANAKARQNAKKQAIQKTPKPATNQRLMKKIQKAWKELNLTEKQLASQIFKLYSKRLDELTDDEAEEFLKMLEMELSKRERKEAKKNERLGSQEAKQEGTGKEDETKNGSDAA